MSRKNALSPLRKRLNAHELDKREDRMRARRTVAAQLTGQNNHMAKILANFITADPWTRYRWMILGARYVNMKGTIILIAMPVTVVAMVIALHYFVFAR